MTGAITWEQIAFFIGIVIGLLTLWYRVETRISKNAITALDRADAAHENLHAFRLEVAENYAKTTLIKDVEKRILDELHGVRRDVQDAMVKMAGIATHKRQE